MSQQAHTVRRPPAPRLDEGSKSYYRRVEDLLDDEEGGNGEIFLKNVADQVISDGIRLVCSDKDGSRAVEKFLQHSSVGSNVIKKLMKAVSPDFFKLCVNRCGSHVMETLLRTAGRALSVGKGEEGGELLDMFMELISVVEAKLMDYIRHSYASHVLGGVVQVLGGVPLKEHEGRSRYSQEFRKVKMAGVPAQRNAGKMESVPDVFVETLDSIARKIGKFSDLNELLMHQSASPVLQSLLKVLSQRLPDRTNKLTKKIIKLSQVLAVEGGALPDMFNDVVGSHLMETMIQVTSPDFRTLIFHKCFKGHVMQSALHPVANFPLQHLIGTASPALLLEIVADITSIEEILFMGHTGVVVKLVEAAVSCPDVQPILLENLLKAFHTHTSPKHCARVILALMTYEMLGDKEEGEVKGPHPITLHGSLLLQALLKFEHPKTVARSILKMSREELMRCSCDPNGSHVLTAFITSPTITLKRKQKLMDKLEENLVSLCLQKHGSRVVDVVWRMSEVGKKEELAKILLAHEEELAGDFHGKIVLKNCNISHYRKKHEGWLEKQRVANKTRELFQDIIGSESTPAGERRSKRKTISFQSTPKPKRSKK